MGIHKSTNPNSPYFKMTKLGHFNGLVFQQLVADKKAFESRRDVKAFFVSTSHQKTKKKQKSPKPHHALNLKVVFFAKKRAKDHLSHQPPGREKQKPPKNKKNTAGTYGGWQKGKVEKWILTTLRFCWPE